MAPQPKKKSTPRAADLAEGGSTKMFKPQAAGPKVPGRTGKVQSPAPGAKRAEGGGKTPRTIGGEAFPAKPGQCAS